MKYVKLFNWFKKDDDIHSICKKYGIKDYTINSDGSIDVDNYILFNKNLDKLPIRFGSVEAYFNISKNSLTTLEGGPNRVGGDFDCSENKLTTLEGAPNYVGWIFNCNNNILTFEGAPNYIGGNFYCLYNPIYCIWYLFEDYSKVELLNDYDALRIENGRGVCILSRLNGFLEDIGNPKVKSPIPPWLIEKIKKYYEIR